MKDSGIEWLGEVPSHWEVRRIRSFASIFNGATPSSNTTSYWDGDITWITPQDLGDITGRYVGTSARKLTREGYESCATCIADVGAVVVSTRAPIGHIGVLSVPACVNQGCRLIAPDRAVGRSEYLYFNLLSARSELASLGSGSTFLELTGEMLACFRVALPPLPEQTAIVRFLDHNERRIRRYIRDKQKLVVLLEEQKQTIIHQAVTGGFDVRTGLPYPAYRTTDVDWLREVPKHWNVRRTKVLFRLRTEKSGTAHGKELLSIYTHIGVRPRKELEERGNKASTTDDYWIVKKGDLIANKLLTWMGAIGVSHYDGVTSPAYDILMPVVNLVSDYYHHLFRTRVYLQQFKQRSRGIMDMRLRLYFDQFGQIPVPVPPVHEQQAIVNFYNEVIVDTDRVIYQTHRQIELVQEYRARLIADVVTGKFDVREAAATLPEVDPLAIEDTSSDTLNTNARSDPYGLDATLEEAEI